MCEKIILVQPRVSLQKLVAAQALGGIIALSSSLASIKLGDTTLRFAPLAAAAGIITGAIVKLLFDSRRVRRSRRVLLLIPDLLAEGIEGEAGKLIIESHYASETRLKRNYTLTWTFHAEGSREILSMEYMRELNNEYAFVAMGDEGVLAAKAFKVNVGEVEAYIVKLHPNIKLHLSRTRLVVRSDGEYGEAFIRVENTSLLLVASHIGIRSRARVVLEITHPFEVRHVLGYAYGKAISIQYSFAPRSDMLLIMSRGVGIHDLTRIMGFKSYPVAMGSGIEGRVRIELLKGPKVIARDETQFHTRLSQKTE